MLLTLSSGQYWVLSERGSVWIDTSDFLTVDIHVKKCFRCRVHRFWEGLHVLIVDMSAPWRHAADVFSGRASHIRALRVDYKYPLAEWFSWDRVMGPFFSVMSASF